MAIKPQNVIPVLKDKLIVYPITAASNTGGFDLHGALAKTNLVESLDVDNDWEVVEFYFITTVALSNNACEVKLGTTARPVTSYATAVVEDVDRFASDATTLQAAAGTAVGDKTQIPLLAVGSDPKVLKAGCMLNFTISANANTGQGFFGVRLRPQEKVHENASKRGKISYPVNAAAQNPNA